jgi:hypothetical protein
MRISKLVISNSVLCLFILAQAGFSQNAVSRNSADVFAGYSLDRQTGGSVGHGWNASVAVNVTDYFAVVADFSRHGISDGVGLPGIFAFSSGGHVMTYRFGPKFTWRMSRLEPFAQTLIGGARLDADAGFTAGSVTYTASQSLRGWSTAAGGGLDVKVNSSWSVRVVQFEHNAWHFQGLKSNGFRASFGALFKFGGITAPH